MLTQIHPKLPMRNKAVTRTFYVSQLGFTDVGTHDYPDYLIVQKDTIQLHFFLFETLNPLDNYGQVYIRTDDIHAVYASLPNSKQPLRRQLWGQTECSILDPDHNLLTFGQAL